MRDKDSQTPPPHLFSRRKRIVRTLLVLAVLYLFAAYLVIPFVWELYAHRHPSFDGNPRLTRTGDDHPGDPLNVSLIGTKEQVVDQIAALAKAGIDGLILSWPRYEEGMRDFGKTTLPLLKQAGLR